MGRQELQLLQRLRANDCRYCYAKRMAKRGGRIKSDAEWSRPEVCRDKVTDRMGKIAQRAVMFPTTHDITPRNLKTCRPCYSTCSKAAIGC